MSDDIHPSDYYDVVGRPAPKLDYNQSQALEKRDKFFIEYGIALGLSAAASEREPDLSKARIDQVYRNRLNLNRKNGIKL